MASISTHIHPQADMAFEKMSKLAPQLQIGGLGPTGEPVTSDDIMGLKFTDPDGETHIYILSDDGKAGLIATLTGGVHIATGPVLL